MSNISLNFFIVIQPVFSQVGSYPSCDAFIGKTNRYSSFFNCWGERFLLHPCYTFRLSTQHQSAMPTVGVNPEPLSAAGSDAEECSQSCTSPSSVPLLCPPAASFGRARKHCGTLGESGCFLSFDCHVCGISQEERGQGSDGKSTSTSTRHLARSQPLLRN